MTFWPSSEREREWAQLLWNTAQAPTVTQQSEPFVLRACVCVCSQAVFGSVLYLSGSVFTPITGLSLLKTLLATSSIVPSPKQNKLQLENLHCVFASVVWSLCSCDSLPPLSWISHSPVHSLHHDWAQNMASKQQGFIRSSFILANDRGADHKNPPFTTSDFPGIQPNKKTNTKRANSAKSHLQLR